MPRIFGVNSTRETPVMASTWTERLPSRPPELSTPLTSRTLAVQLFDTATIASRINGTPTITPTGFPFDPAPRAATNPMMIHRHIGIPIPLARVADDLDRSYWGVHVGLYDVCAAWDDVEALDPRTELAREFHYVDDYAPARRILELVLAEDSDHPGATILMGDIAVHEQDWDRALDWTDRALRVAPHDLNAHEDRVDALVGAERWSDAAAAASRRLAMGALDADAPVIHFAGRSGVPAVSRLPAPRASPTLRRLRRPREPPGHARHGLRPRGGPDRGRSARWPGAPPRPG